MSTSLYRVVAGRQPRWTDIVVLGFHDMVPPTSDLRHSRIKAMVVERGGLYNEVALWTKSWDEKCDHVSCAGNQKQLQSSR